MGREKTDTEWIQKTCLKYSGWERRPRRWNRPTGVTFTNTQSEKQRQRQPPAFQPRYPGTNTMAPRTHTETEQMTQRIYSSTQDTTCRRSWWHKHYTQITSSKWQFILGQDGIFSQFTLSKGLPNLLEEDVCAWFGNLRTLSPFPRPGFHLPSAFSHCELALTCLLQSDWWGLISYWIFLLRHKKQRQV